MVLAGLSKGMLICANSQPHSVGDPGQGHLPLVTPSQPDQTDRLHDMVRAEAELAWQQLQHKSTPHAPMLTGAVTPTKQHEIRSIYGVGNRLYAEVVLDAQPYLFVSGRSQALQGSDRQWVLQRIQPPCVHLRRGEVTHVFCLGASIE